MPFSFLDEFGVGVLLEALCYGTGRVLAFFFATHVGVEPLGRQKSQRWWSRDGFTYMRGRHRYLHAESVTFIGMVFWFLGAAVATFLWLHR